MTNITFTEFAAMSLAPIKRAIQRWFLDMQIRGHDRHIDGLRESINNDMRAMGVLSRERVNLAARRSGLR